MPPGALLLWDRLYCSIELFEQLDAVGAFGLFRLKRNLKVVEVERLSRRRKDGALTNVLDPQRLSAEEVTALHPCRWQVERLFFDLKEVLCLHKFYAANPNAVSMQVFAAAMVHAAFRIAQGRIAKSHDIPAEDLSPKELLPRLAVASRTVIEAELHVDKVQITN